MKKLLGIIVLMSAMGLLGCGDSVTRSSELAETQGSARGALQATGESSALGAGQTFLARCSGAQEVPPVETNGQCQAVFRVQNGAIGHTLTVVRLENIFAAHIHCGRAGVNGAVGVTLFQGGPTTVNGILSKGAILEPNAGNACGWTDLGDIVAALSSGDTYVNVHTLSHLPGEVRGQIR